MPFHLISMISKKKPRDNQSRGFLQMKFSLQSIFQ
jgi:hypothetical protein